jgi:hypothetical protein
MPIILQDIRTAVQTYLDTKVSVAISALTPQSGAQIGQNEEFCFSISVANATSAAGGVALKNVRYYLRVDNTTIGKLIVPAAPMVARSGYLVTSPALAAGSQVGEMYLFPSDEKNYLDPGETDVIGTTVYTPTALVRGKSGTPATGSSTSIRFKVLAEVDQDYLFPKNEDSPSTARTLTVVF